MEGKIFESLIKIMEDVSPLVKNGENKFDNYKYAKIDDITANLRPIFVKHDVLVVPFMVDEQSYERQGSKGYALHYTKVKMRFTFYHKDGSSVVSEITDEAMDSGDKGYNKAIMAALKYTLIPMFLLSTGENLDTEKDKEQPAPKSTPAPKPKEKPTYTKEQKALWDCILNRLEKKEAPSEGLAKDLYYEFLKSTEPVTTDMIDIRIDEYIQNKEPV